MTTPVRFPYAGAEAGRSPASRLAYVPITLGPRAPFHNRFGVAGYGFNGQRVAVPDWPVTWVRVGATDHIR